MLPTTTVNIRTLCTVYLLKLVVGQKYCDMAVEEGRLVFVYTHAIFRCCCCCEGSYMFLASSGLQQHPPGLMPRKFNSRPVWQTEHAGNTQPHTIEQQHDSPSSNLSETLQRRHIGKHPPTKYARQHIPQSCVSGLASMAEHCRPIWQQAQKRVSKH